MSSPEGIVADLTQQLKEANEELHETKARLEHWQKEADEFYDLLGGRESKIEALEKELDVGKDVVRDLQEKLKSSNAFLKETYEERDTVIGLLEAADSAQANIEEKLEICEQRAQQLESDLEKTRLRADMENTPEHLRPGPTSEQVKQLEEEWKMNREKEDKPRNARLEKLEALVREYQTEKEAHETQTAVNAAEMATEMKRMREEIESYENQIEQLWEERGRFELNPEAYSETQNRFDLNPEAHSEARDPTAPFDRWGRRRSLSQEFQLKAQSLDDDIEDQESVHSNIASVVGDFSDNIEPIVSKSVQVIGLAQRQTTWSHFAKVNVDTYKYVVHTITAVFRKAPSGPITPSGSGSSLWYEVMHPLQFPKPRPWPLLFDFALQIFFITSCYCFYLGWKVIEEKNLWLEGNDATGSYISDIYFNRHGRGIGFPKGLQGLVQRWVEIETYPMPG